MNENQFFPPEQDSTNSSSADKQTDTTEETRSERNQERKEKPKKRANAFSKGAWQVAKGAGKASKKGVKFLGRGTKDVFRGLKRKFSHPDFEPALAFLFLVGIVFIGPFHQGWYGLSLSNFDWTSLIVPFCIFLFLYLVNRFRALSSRRFMALSWVLVINFVAAELYTNLSSLSFFGSSQGQSYIAFILALILLGVFILHEIYPDVITSRIMTGIFLLVLVGVFATYLYGYFTGGGFGDSVEQQQAEIESQNYNFFDIFRDWFTRQQALGNGSLIAGQMENTYRFMGLEILSVAPQRDRYFVGEEVLVDIDYQSSVFFPLTLFTTCRTKNAVGTVDQPVIEISSVSRPSVRCNLGQLTRGTHVVDVVASYNYASTVHIPLVIMEKDFSETITKRIENPVPFLEEYVGGTRPAITTAGPVQIGVATIGSTLQTPLLYDASAPRLSRLRLQFQEEELHGEVYLIEEASFDVPEGIEITRCDFGVPQRSTSTLYQDRWIYTLDGSNLNVEDYKTFTCDLEIDANYASTLLPQTTRWSIQSLYFTLNYYYKVEESATVQVTS